MILLVGILGTMTLKAGDVKWSIHCSHPGARVPAISTQTISTQTIFGSASKRGILGPMIGDGLQYDPADFPDPHKGEVDVSLIELNLVLSPRDRLEKHEDLLAAVHKLREAGIKHYGFDPAFAEGAR